MAMKIIHTDKAPAAIGPYSQGYIAGDFLFTSGQGGLNPEDGSVHGKTVEEQADQTCRNLQAILEAAGTDFTKVVKATCYLADMNDFKAFNGVYEKYIVSKPARTCVAVKTLPLGILCEIELVVYLK
jgi:reactive intermediate/imine deaminase